MTKNERSVKILDGLNMFNGTNLALVLMWIKVSKKAKIRKVHIYVL